MAGPCGIHLILASSEPACLRGLKESFPARVCLKVRSASDSVALLDQKGGEELPRKGSLLYMDGHDPDPQMLQSGTITAKEIRGVINALGSNYINLRKQSIFDEIEDEDPEDQGKRDPQKGILSRFRK